ncbi:MAG TPA: hypothetical protein VF168_10505 [Trueperaceae bacterium]
MITASRVALASSLTYFLLANTLGLLMGSGLVGYVWRPAHAHLNLLGFVSMMIYGVAYHALPRFSGRPFKRPRLALTQIVLANIGLLGMALVWGLALPPALFALWGGIEYLSSLLFVFLIGELLLPERGSVGGRGLG